MSRKTNLIKNGYLPNPNLPQITENDQSWVVGFYQESDPGATLTHSCLREIKLFIGSFSCHFKPSFMQMTASQAKFSYICFFFFQFFLN